VSPVLLIADLGRPSRFLNMLRVFKPTSAMSVGSWILAAYSTAAPGRGLEGPRAPPPPARLLGAGALLGLPMATYTGVLVADSSIPVWHEARRELPALFAASGAASAGAALLLLTPADEAAPARRVAVAGAVAELAIDRAMEQRLGEFGEVYEEDLAGRYGRMAKGLTAAGALVVALGGRRRATTAAGSAMILAGSACLRWSVFRAGFQSAADPKYVVKPQRERLARGEGNGSAILAGTQGPRRRAVVPRRVLDSIRALPVAVRADHVALSDLRKQGCRRGGGDHHRDGGYLLPLDVVEVHDVGRVAPATVDTGPVLDFPDELLVPANPFTAELRDVGLVALLVLVVPRLLVGGLADAAVTVTASRAERSLRELGERLGLPAAGARSVWGRWRGHGWTVS
jgi:hypothetical protein